MLPDRKGRFRREPLICPKCGEHIAPGDLGKEQCSYCHAAVTLANSYIRWVVAFTVAFVIALGILTHQDDSGGTWLFGLFCSAIPIYLILSMMLPPWLKKGTYQFTFSLGQAFIIAVIDIFLVMFVLGTLVILILGSKADVRQHLEELSWPLVAISRNFLITPQKTFIDVCGILLGNSAFYGLVWFGCVSWVRWSSRRVRTIRLSLSGKNPTDED